MSELDIFYLIKINYFYKKILFKFIYLNKLQIIRLINQINYINKFKFFKINKVTNKN